ncbi:unnamed protein product [Adineta ricciae]|uniref:Uncharacterized protein n=1 Tax=Adineta ricciae TaxID=249248 RepID=A0A816DV51_ADIRI|nr:unnamed protein product [Adineta ricciae]
MRFLNFLVFANLFLVPILFHPLNICRHLIHIGHEPFQPEPLSTNSFESYLFNIFQYSPFQFVKPRSRFQRISEYFLQPETTFSKKLFYPNVIQYTNMYLIDHDLSPCVHSFVAMYLSYFLLIYISSLVHVYRLSSKRTSLNEIRSCAQQWIESSYLRWIFHAIFWKSLAVIISHLFHIMAVKIIMQRLFISYGHYQLNDEVMYSSWNFYKNIILIYKYEQWTALFSGFCTRMIYELGLTCIPRLLWWPIRRLCLQATLNSYFHASSIELYFLQCICEPYLRCFSIYLQLFARLTTIEIVNQMHVHPNLDKYPLLILLRHHHHHLKQPWSFLLSINLIDAKLISSGLSFFLRQAN